MRALARSIAALAMQVGCGDNRLFVPDAARPDARLAGTRDAPADIALDMPIDAVFDVADGTHRTIIVFAFENEPQLAIYGNTRDAPYLDSLRATSGYATSFVDRLPTLPSEPHYVWMEAGTNAFADRVFVDDADPSAVNSTASTTHLATQITNAGLEWRAYQEGIVSHTCPIATAGAYAPKHDPFVFFQDIVGATPSTTAEPCASHHVAIDQLAIDLAANTMPNYAFVTPDLCHDMHGDASCPQGTDGAANIAAGDAWLAANLPAAIEFTHAHDATIFITWDEGDRTNVLPFYAIGDRVVVGPDPTRYSHGSLVKTIEQLLGLPILPAVAAEHDLSAMVH